MHSRLIYNHQLVEATKARAEVLTGAALYGRGVFTTVAVHDGQPFLWRAHWWRLVDHAARAGVDLSDLDEQAVRHSLARLIAANGVKHGRARVTLLARDRLGPWALRSAPGMKTDLLILSGERREVKDEGLSLTVSPYRVNTLSPLAGVKSVNYLEHLMAWEEARARDFDESVALNERGEVVSATMANLFWVSRGKIHTPSLQTGALAGTTRARVIELAQELSVPLVEGVYELSDVGDADEIFLTSAGLGVAIVTTFDFHQYRVTVGSIALRVHEAFRQLTLRDEHFD